MSRSRQLVIAVAATVIVVVVIGMIAVVSRGSGHGTSALATQAAGTTPVPLPGTADSPAVLDGDTYLIGDPFPVPVTVTVPAGWTGEVAGPYAAFLSGVETSGPATMAFTVSENIFADPCLGKGLLDPQPGPRVDDLTSALTHLRGVVATTPTAVTVDGVKGKQLTLTAPAESAECSGSVDGYELWELPLGHTFALAAGERMAVWVLDDHGTRLLVSRHTSPQTSTKDRAALQAVLDSVRLGKPA